MPWEERVECSFDRYWNCFKVDVKIKVGSVFKFVLDTNKQYLPSNRYEKIKD